MEKLKKQMESRPPPRTCRRAIFQKWQKSVETVLVELINEVKTDEDKMQWSHGNFWTTCRWPCNQGKIRAALTRLKKLESEIGKSFPKSPLVVTSKFRVMFADYIASMQEAEKDNDAKQKIHDRWLNDLGDFLEEHPKFDEALDASLQLAQEFEFAGKVEKAAKWYQRVVKDFGDAPAAARATGALKRLDLVGKPLTLAGQGLSGGTIDINKSYKGKVLCVLFWDTTNRQYIDDLSGAEDAVRHVPCRRFRDHRGEYGSRKGAAAQFIQKHAIKWPQIYTPGGQDSPLAVEYGIFVLPTMFIVDRDGKVLNRGATVADLKTTLAETLTKK